MKKIILFAEDDNLVMQMYESIGPRLFPDYDLEFFSDGTSLEKRFKEGVEGVCAILSDNQMPGIDGSKLVEKYAFTPEFKDIKFILNYGGCNSIGKKAVENGAATYFIKPTSLGKIRDFLDSDK